jgi:hypothetical protein
MTAPALAKNIGGIRHYPDGDGGWVPSVTAVLGVLDLNVDGLISWASNIGVAVGMEIGPEGDLDDAKRIAHARRRESSKVGDSVHASLELIAKQRMNGEPVMFCEWETDECRGYVKAGDDFMFSQVKSIDAVEVTLLGDGYAGSVDLVATLHDGTKAAIDWKTGKQHGKHALQVAAYAMAKHALDLDGTPIDPPDMWAGIVVYLHADGTWTAINVEDIDDAYEAFQFALSGLENVIHVNDSIKNAITTSVIQSVDAAPSAPEGAAAPVEPSGPPSPEVGAASAPSVLEDRRAWVVERAGTIAETPEHWDELMAIWPEGAPKVSEAGEGWLDRMAKACSEIEQAHRYGFSDPDPATDEVPGNDPRALAVLDLAERLPHDLVQNVLAEMKTAGYPSISSGRCTDAQVATVRGWVESCHVEHTARVAIVREAFESIAATTDDHTLSRLLDLGDTLTEDDVEKVVAVTSGIKAGVVKVSVDSTLSVILEADEAALVALCGSKRELLSLAKGEAQRLGFHPPKSTAEVLADPILSGAVAGAA